jgi:hypothetical protein
MEASMMQFVAMVMLSAGQGNEARQEGAEKDVKLLAQASWPFTRADPAGVGKGGIQKAIRSEAELLAASGLPGDGRSKLQIENFLKKSLKVDKVDFDKQMLILVTAGTQPSGGFRVEVTKATVKDKAMSVAWQLQAPKGVATAVLTHPAAVVLVDRFDGKVLFAAGKADKK